MCPICAQIQAVSFGESLLADFEYADETTLLSFNTRLTLALTIQADARCRMR